MRFAIVLSTTLSFWLIAGTAGGVEKKPPPASPDGQYQLGDRLNAPTAADKRPGYETITWDRLLPKNWDPDKMVESLNLDKLEDNDPRTREMMAKIQAMWASAPINAELNDKRVRISGFAVPIERERGRLIREFLLVPYFGACIHTPPPPANQIIHVVMAKPFEDSKMMGTLWVNGTMQTVRKDIGRGMGTAGYKITADSLDPFKMDLFPF